MQYDLLSLLIWPSILPLGVMVGIYLYIPYFFQEFIIPSQEMIRAIFYENHVGILTPIIRYLCYGVILQMLQMIGSWALPFILPRIHRRITLYMFDRLQTLKGIGQNRSYLLVKDFTSALITTLEVLLGSFFPKVLELTMLIITCFSAHYLAGVFTVFWVIVLVLLGMYMMRRQIAKDRVLREIRHQTSILVRENYNNYLVNQCFPHSKQWQRRELNDMLLTDDIYYASFLRFIGVSKFVIGMVNLAFCVLLVLICHRNTYLNFPLRVILFTSFWSATRTIWRFVTGMSGLVGLFSRIRHGYQFFSLPQIEEAEHLTSIKSIQSFRLCKPSIQIQNKTISYKTQFELQEPGLYILSGASGVGKSIILNTILKYHDHSQGSIFINNQPLEQLRRSQLVSGIVYMPQVDLIYNASIEENIILRNKQSKNMREFYESCGISLILDRAKKSARDIQCGEGGRRLSGGEKKLICFARMLYALRNAPEQRLVMLDEPFNYLDRQYTDYVFRAIREISLKHIVLSTSHTDIMHGYAKRILFVERVSSPI